MGICYDLGHMNDVNNKYLLPGAVLIGLLFIGGAVLYNGSGSGSSSTGTVKPVALTANAKKIAQDVKDNTAAYQALVDADRTAASQVEIAATPSFLIGKQVIAGAYPYVAFQTAIDNVLAGKAPVADQAHGIKVSKFDSKDIVRPGDPFIGKADAPVTIAFWSDFQCPYCKAFETGGVPGISNPAALPDIIKDYVDTGKVKVVFMDFVFLGQDSISAALYGRAVWKLFPDKYFDWRTQMYVAQDAEGDQGFGDPDSIDQLNAKFFK